MLVRGWPNGGSDVFCYSIVLPDVVKSVYEKQGGKKNSLSAPPCQIISNSMLFHCLYRIPAQTTYV